MTCGHCVRAVTGAVQALDPSATVAVDLAAGRVTVKSGSAPAAGVIAAIQAEGYQAEAAP